MFGSNERQTQSYTTSDWDGGKGGPPRNPVVAVQELPDGPIHVFDDIRDSYGPL